MCSSSGSPAAWSAGLYDEIFVGIVGISDRLDGITEGATALLALTLVAGVCRLVCDPA